MDPHPARPDAIRRLGRSFRWPGGRRICVVFNLAFEGWSDGIAPGVGPMGNPLKPGVLDTNAINWADYGGRCGIWRLLDVLADAEVRASVMACGVMAERWPAAMAAIRAAGHEVVAHSHAMDILPAALDPEAERANLRRTVALLGPCRGWISPRGTPSLATARILADEGFDWYGDVFDDDLPYVMDFAGRPLVAIPLTMEVNDLPFVMRFGNPPQGLVEVFATLLEWFRTGERGASYVDVTAHTHVFGRPLGGGLCRDAGMARADPEVWIATRAEVADWVLSAEGGAPHLVADR
jgi:hypothetical protein